MTGWVSRVELIAPCDRECGHDAVWYGTRGGDGGTNYRVECVHCDRSWTLAAQIARRLERITNPIITRSAA